MVRSSCAWLALGVILLAMLVSCSDASPTAGIDGYAVLMEVNDHPEGYQDIPIDPVHVTWMSETLTKLGWTEDHILVKTDAEVTEGAVRDAFEWLGRCAGEDDLVVFLIAAHGSFIRTELRWHETFPEFWAGLSTPRKLLLVESCHAGEFSRSGAFGPDVAPEERELAEVVPGIAIGCVGTDEYGWVGTEEEGDPIIGSSFLYYLAPAFGDDAADANDDGFVSVEEAFAVAAPLTRSYHRDVVFGNHPDYLPLFESMHTSFDPEDFPHPDLIDEYPGELILDLEFYR